MVTWFTSGKNKGKTTREVLEKELNVKKGKAEYKYSAQQLDEASRAPAGTFMSWATKIFNPPKKKK
jgi:hypothetical protein